MDFQSDASKMNNEPVSHTQTGISSRQKGVLSWLPRKRVDADISLKS